MEISRAPGNIAGAQNFGFNSDLEIVQTWRRVELVVIDLTRDGIGEAADAPLLQNVVRHLDVDVLRGDYSEVQHGHGLVGRARKVVKKPALGLAFLGVERLLDNVDGELVGNEAPRRHVIGNLSRCRIRKDQHNTHYALARQGYHLFAMGEIWCRVLKEWCDLVLAKLEF